MERKRIICLFLFVVLILVFSACHPRHVSDIKPNHDERRSGLFVGEDRSYQF